MSLLKATGPAAVNADVRAKILELIQSWAAVTEGRYELAYIGEVYKTLQREGFQFPPSVAVASSMIDSSAVGVIPSLPGLSYGNPAHICSTTRSPPSGPTRMFVCGAGRRSRLRIANTTAGTVVAALTSSVRPSRSRCPTLG